MQELLLAGGKRVIVDKIFVSAGERARAAVVDGVVVQMSPGTPQPPTIVLAEGHYYYLDATGTPLGASEHAPHIQHLDPGHRARALQQIEAVQRGRRVPPLPCVTPPPAPSSVAPPPQDEERTINEAVFGRAPAEPGRVAETERPAASGARERGRPSGKRPATRRGGVVIDGDEALTRATGGITVEQVVEAFENT